MKKFTSTLTVGLVIFALSNNAFAARVSGKGTVSGKGIAIGSGVIVGKGKAYGKGEAYGKGKLR